MLERGIVVKRYSQIALFYATRFEVYQQEPAIRFSLIK